MDDAIDRQRQIEAMLNQRDGQDKAMKHALSPTAVMDKLNRLEDVLASDNVSMGNIELCLHIDRIECHPDKRVVLRTCKLGALTGAVELLRNEAIKPANNKAVKPRRRTRRQATEDFELDWQSTAEWAADPNRFAGLGEQWFQETEFRIPEKEWPYQKMAIDIAMERLAGLTHEKLSERFSVSVPTVRKALKHAATIDDRFRNLPRKMGRPRWHEEHAQEVAAMKAHGHSADQIAAHFNKSDTTIREALKHAGTHANGSAVSQVES